MDIKRSNKNVTGYIVYRDFSTRKCIEEDWAQVHWVAKFKYESEAKDYSEYRNEMAHKYGTDEVSAIERSNV